MNALDFDMTARNRAASAAQRIALIRENDKALQGSLAEQMQILGIAEVIPCPTVAAENILENVPCAQSCAGVLVLGMRDAVVGPVEVADLRRQLPKWVIIVLDHVGTAHSSADALAAGADDVLRHPYPPREIEARIALRMRQAGMMGTCAALDAPLFGSAQLTPVESEIVRILMSRKGQIVTRNHLSQRLDQSDWLYGDRKFDVHITRIRKKLRSAFGEKYMVSTIRSKGYLFHFAGESISV